MSTQTRSKKKSVPNLADLDEQFVQLKHLQKRAHKAETAVKGSGGLLKCLVEKYWASSRRCTVDKCQTWILRSRCCSSSVSGQRVEAYRRILEAHPDQKAIILSGYAMSNRVEKALKLGAGMFVSKPITQKILAEAVRRELDKKRKKKHRSGSGKCYSV